MCRVRASTNFDRLERIYLDFLPPLEADDAQKPGSYSKLYYFMSSLMDRGTFMEIFESSAADFFTRARLLKHSGGPVVVWYGPATPRELWSQGQPDLRQVGRYTSPTDRPLHIVEIW